MQDSTAPVRTFDCVLRPAVMSPRSVSVSRVAAWCSAVALAAPCLITPPTLHAQSATLVADAAVSKSRPALNFATLSNLYVSSDSTTVLRFDLGTLPGTVTASQVGRATLRVYVNRVNTPGVIGVAPVLAAWAEGAVTAQTMPALGSAAQVAAVTDEGQYVTFDVTALVQAWVKTPATNFGIALSATTADVVLDSKENDTTAHPAELLIALLGSTQGPAGPQGPKGDKGDTGAAGTTGPQGPKGDKGDPGTGAGLQYRGAWSASLLYASNDVVTYGGAAWVSTANSNIGTAPATGTGWGLLLPAASSSSGSGSNPSTLSFAGAYASTSNYAANAIVTFANAAWISLHDSNHGNTPDASATDWAVLVPAGSGTNTTTVINGLLFDGAYASSTNYATNHVVTWNNAAWASLHDSNHGNAPGVSPGDWVVLVPAAVGLQGPSGATGATGAQGPQGERGFTGAQGPQGDRGATGATGRPGFVYQGTYTSATNYAAGDVVLWQGGSWASLVDANHGNTPDASPLNWGPLTSQGPQGVQGDPGAQGPQGIQGPPGQVGAAGPPGPTGPQGSPGPQGAPGRDGAQGPQGDRGLIGPQGPTGPVGLTWQGTYASGTNYATNDAVAWNGQSWLSLHDSNHGNTPESSPSDWTLLAAAGAAGPQGPQGLQGTQGPQGNTGPQGAKGDTGDTGPQGIQGSPGLTYQGVYSSTVNYALHDAVTYSGSTWISLQPANQGNTPDASPMWWKQIAAQGQQGPAGPQGAKGDTGDIGPQGPQGLTGPAGPQGQPVHFLGAWSGTTSYVTGDAVFLNGSAYIATAAVTGNPPGVSPSWQLLAQKGDAGPTGAQGVQGVAGAQGATGAVGPAGPTGSPGLRWKGAWSSSTGYLTGDAVSFSGSAFISISDTNINVTPGSGLPWQLLAQQGSTGPAGPAGTNGANGGNGAAATVQVGTVTTSAPGSGVVVQNAGTANAAVLNFSIPQGATGAAGTPGLTWQGTWTTGTGYSTGDVVFRNGSACVSLHGTNTVDPVVSVANNTGDWQILASQGSPGAATVSIGAVTAGTSAAVTNSGTQNAAVLNFTLPKGDPGAAGPAGLVFFGPWSSATQYPATSVVTWNGSSYVAIASSSGVHPTGDAGSASAWSTLASKGDAGATGPSGTTPAFAISAVHTGAAGSAAAVTNVGTSTNIQLDFTIPQGATGATGATGPAGSGGTSTASLFTSVHSVAGSSTQFHSPVADKVGTSETGAVLAFLPSTCNLASVQVYNFAPATASFTIRTGTPGSMAANPSTACTAAPNVVTTCTGPGSLSSGSFVSFVIASASTVASFVYTQFSCN